MLDELEQPLGARLSPGPVGEPRPVTPSHPGAHRAHVISDTPGWRWKAEVSIPITTEGCLRLWGSSVDETAPSAAIAGFVAALMDPAPLLRDEGQEPHTLFHLTSTRNTVLPEQLQQMHLQRLEECSAHHAAQVAPASRPSSPRPAHRRKRR
jgi:hypothetical protein